MNVYARFDEIPSMTFKDIKKTKCYGRMDGQHEDSIVTLPQTQFAWGITIVYDGSILQSDTSSENVINFTFVLASQTALTLRAHYKRFRAHEMHIGIIFPISSLLRRKP